ncbi:MAG: iron-containing alcohol dehydrogenase [Bacteroidales bacterium]
MVDPFQLINTPHILFGPGKIKELPEQAGKCGNNILLIHGSGSFIQSEKGREIIASLDDNGFRVSKASVSHEPSPALIDGIVQENVSKNIDIVVAIGGGSVLDTGKAVSAMLALNEPVKDYLEGVGSKKPDGRKLPFIAIPTTSGTGSEATNNAVISEVGENGFKKSLRHNNYVPDIALVDPELVLSCPTAITAASGMDAFTQLLEAYVSTKASVLTDAWAWEGLKAVHRALEKAVHSGDDLTARTDMSFAALISGFALANAGLGLVHGFASSIGGLIDMPHGQVCGTLMAAVHESNIKALKTNDPESPALNKYVKVGVLFAGETLQEQSDDYYLDQFIRRLNDMTESFGLERFSGYGLTESQAVEIAEEKTGNKNNPVNFSAEARKDILLRRL